MRDAFGGIFMIRLMLVVVFIFVAFTAVSLNYAKAFRIKNSVIDLIEQQEVLSLDSMFRAGDNVKIRKLNSILNKSNYNKQCRNVDTDGKIERAAGENVAYCYRGVVIEEKETIDRTIVYSVSTYAGWNLGVFNKLLAITGKSRNSQYVMDGAWEINGEARVVKRK